MRSVASLIIDYAPEKPLRDSLAGGPGSYDRVLETARSLGFPVFVFSVHGGPGVFAFQGDLYSLFCAIDSVSENFQHLLFFHSELPLLDAGLAREMVNTHLECIADYTMAEHYPEGFAPFLINRGTFKKLHLTAYGNNQPYHRRVLDQMIQSDINSYDVEIVIAPEDLRKVREAFSVEHARGRMLCEAFLKNPVPAKELGNWFLSNAPALRPLPAVVTLEITSQCQQTCLYCPHSLAENDEKILSLTNFQALMKELSGWLEKGRIELSGYGEPLTHPEIEGILDTLKDYPQFEFLLETNGLLLDRFMNQILSIPSLTVMISLDAPEKSLYEKLRGPGFEKAEENAEKFLSKAPEKGYLQITRMKDNEDFLDGFLERWRAFQSRILIQKYNDFCKAFEDRRVVDLSPLKPFACWKLQRELLIRADLSVPLCVQDFKNSFSAGRALETPLPEIWKNLDQAYELQWKEGFQGLCKNCDQWYIFS